MRIEVALTPEEARELRSHAFLGSSYFRFWLRHPVASFAVVGSVFFAGKWATPRYLGVSLVEALVPLGVLLAGGGLLLWLALDRLDPHRRCAAFALELTAEGVERTCAHGRRLTPWSAVESLAETPRLILVQLVRGGTIGIPKRSLAGRVTPQDLHAIIRRLRSQPA